MGVFQIDDLRLQIEKSTTQSAVAFNHQSQICNLESCAGGTGCRLIEMRATTSFGESRRLGAQGPVDLVSSFAICVTDLDEFRSLQCTDTTAGWRKLHRSQHLRQKSRRVIAVQFCPNWSKTLRRLEIRQTRKKLRRFCRLPAAPALSFPRKRPEPAAPSGGKKVQNPPVQRGCSTSVVVEAGFSEAARPRSRTPDIIELTFPGVESWLSI